MFEGKSRRSQVAQGFMGPLCVVLKDPAVDDFLYLT